MDRHGMTDIGRRNHAAVRDAVHSRELLLDHQRQNDIVHIPIVFRSELDIIERHGRIAPQRAPFGNHLLHETGIKRVVARVDIRLALIPDETAGRQATQRIDHRIEQKGGLIVIVESRIRLQYLRIDPASSRSGHPCLDARTAPIGLDQTDRHAERIVQTATEKITGRTERCNALRRRHGPCASAAVPRFGRRCPGNAEQTHVAIETRTQHRFVRTLGRLAGQALDRHLHVRLPGANPHFADHHVLQRNGIAIADTDRIRTAGSGSGNFQQPLAVGVGLRRIFAAVPRGRDRHLFRRRSLPPQVHLALPLEHHVAADQRRQFDLGESRASHQQRQADKQNFFHSISTNGKGSGTYVTGASRSSYRFRTDYFTSFQSSVRNGKAGSPPVLVSVAAAGTLRNA